MRACQTRILRVSLTSLCFAGTLHSSRPTRVRRGPHIAVVFGRAGQRTRITWSLLLRSGAKRVRIGPTRPSNFAPTLAFVHGGRRKLTEVWTRMDRFEISERPSPPTRLALVALLQCFTLFEALRSAWPSPQTAVEGQTPHPVAGVHLDGLELRPPVDGAPRDERAPLGRAR